MPHSGLRVGRSDSSDGSGTSSSGGAAVARSGETVGDGDSSGRSSGDDATLSAAAPSHRLTFGGGAAASAAAWVRAQERLDCAAREGTWEDHAAPQLLFPVAAVLRDASSELCHAPPWTRAREPSLWFAWEPTAAAAARGCPAVAREWSRAAFCAALRGRDILLVGDSLTFTLHDTLLSALLDAGAPALREHVQWDECPTHALCEAEAAAAAAAGSATVRTASMRFIRNDHATVAPSGANEARNEQMWTGALTPNTLLVVNRGAHYVPDDRLEAGVRETLAWVAAHAPRGMGAIWRNTVPGHELGDFLYEGNFSRFRTPLRERLVYAPDAAAAKYNWNSFPRQNSLVERLVAEAAAAAPDGAPAWLFLDVENSTVLRADRHRDGLHYCVPGPTDAWVRLLLVALEEANAAADASGGLT